MWKMWKRQSAQKWDAIKYFICVIEFRWVIVLRHLKSGSEGRRRIQKNRAPTFSSAQWKPNKFSSPIKSATHFMDEKRSFHVLTIRLSWYAFSFIAFFAPTIFSSLPRVSVRRCACLALYWLVEQSNIFSVFSLLLHYSFRCHFCSIYLNCGKKRKHKRVGKMRWRECNVFEMSNKFLKIFSVFFVGTLLHCIRR